MARVVGFENMLRATCGWCSAIIEYREGELKSAPNDIPSFANGLYCPNCGRWIGVYESKAEDIFKPSYTYRITYQADEEKTRVYYSENNKTVVPRKPKFYEYDKDDYLTPQDILNDLKI